MSKKNFTAKQVKWASEHDWFVIGNEETIIGCAVYSNGAKETCSFTNFQALRDWAGY